MITLSGFQIETIQIQFVLNFQEIFQGQKYKMSVEDEGFVHKLVISNPTLADMGKYTCEVNGVITEAYLEVEGNDVIPF